MSDGFDFDLAEEMLPMEPGSRPLPTGCCACGESIGFNEAKVCVAQRGPNGSRIPAIFHPRCYREGPL